MLREECFNFEAVKTSLDAYPRAGNKVESCVLNLDLASIQLELRRNFRDMTNSLRRFDSRLAVE